MQPSWTVNERQFLILKSIFYYTARLSLSNSFRFVSSYSSYCQKRDVNKKVLIFDYWAEIEHDLLDYAAEVLERNFY